MHIEIQKNVITSMEVEDVVQYEIVPLDETLVGSFEDLKALRNFLDSYIRREEALQAAKID